MAGKEKIVVDASVVTKWYSEEEDTSQAVWYKQRHVEGGLELVAPALLLYEVANALSYKPDFTEKDVCDSINALLELSLTLELPTTKVVEKTISLSKDYGITVYDSSYIALAESLNIRMVTADKKLWNKIKGRPSVSFLAL